MAKYCIALTIVFCLALNLQRPEAIQQEKFKGETKEGAGEEIVDSLVGDDSIKKQGLAESVQDDEIKCIAIESLGMEASLCLQSIDVKSQKAPVEDSLKEALAEIQSGNGKRLFGIELELENQAILHELLRDSIHISQTNDCDQQLYLTIGYLKRSKKVPRILDGQNLPKGANCMSKYKQPAGRIWEATKSITYLGNHKPDCYNKSCFPR